MVKIRRGRSWTQGAAVPPPRRHSLCLCCTRTFSAKTERVSPPGEETLRAVVCCDMSKDVRRGG